MPAAPETWQEYLSSPAGTADAAWQVEAFGRAVAPVLGNIAFQLGQPGINALEKSRILLRILAVPGMTRLAPEDIRLSILAEGASLPLECGCADLVVWPHGPDGSTDPASSLREISRIIAPNGLAVLTFFNASGSWNMRRKISPSLSPLPVCASPRTTASVIRDLKDAGLTPEGGMFGVYGAGINGRQPPGWLEKAGDRWWPAFSNLVLVTARKKTAGMTFAGRTTFARTDTAGGALTAGGLPKISPGNLAASGSGCTEGKQETRCG